jgi:ribosome-binding factor A
MSSKLRRRDQSTGPSQRQLRVGETLRHVLSEILMRQDFFDPDLANVSVTISEISVSPDLSNARVYTMPLGGINVDVILPALNRLAPVMQSLVAKKVHLRRTPRLRFFLDNSFENAAKMNQLFHAIKQES